MPDRSTSMTRSPAFRWLERTLLSFGMSAIAFVIERRLLRALKKGNVEAAPRTAATAPSADGAPSAGEGGQAHVATGPASTAAPAR